MARTATPSDEPLRDFCREVLKQEALLRQGGGTAGLERPRKLGRLPPRERIAQLLDKDAQFFEIGPQAAYTTYTQSRTILPPAPPPRTANPSPPPSLSIP